MGRNAAGRCGAPRVVDAAARHPLRPAAAALFALVLSLNA